MRFILAIVVFSLLAGCSSSPSPVLPPLELTPLDNKINISRQWKFTVGEGVGDFYLKLKPVIHGETGYVVDYQGSLYSFNVNTGKRSWELNLETPISAGLTFANENLYLGNSKGEVIAVDIKKSKILWRAQLSSEILSSPVIAKGTLVVKTVDGRIYGLNAETGRQDWEYELSVPLLTLRGNSSAVISNDIVLSASDSGKLTALTLKQGKVLWETTIAVAQGRNELERIIDIDVDPVVVDDVIYVAGYQGRLAAVKIGSGEIIWNRDFSSYSGLYVDSQRVYITDAAGQIWALNRYNGSTLWRQDKLLRRQLTAPQAQDRYLVVGDYDGYLHWLSREDGSLIARKRMNSSDIVTEDDEDGFEIDKKLELLFSKVNNILITPLVINKLVISFDRSGHLEAFQLENN